jgi:hypothetical protein
VRTQAIVALIANCCGLLLCGLTLPGVITSAIALSRVDHDLPSGRRLLMWSWILLALAVVVFALLMVAVVGLIAVGSTSP